MSKLVNFKHIQKSEFNYFVHSHHKTQPICILRRRLYHHRIKNTVRSSISFKSTPYSFFNNFASCKKILIYFEIQHKHKYHYITLFQPARSVRLKLDKTEYIY